MIKKIFFEPSTNGNFEKKISDFSQLIILLYQGNFLKGIIVLPRNIGTKCEDKNVLENGVNFYYIIQVLGHCNENSTQQSIHYLVAFLLEIPCKMSLPFANVTIDVEC